LSSLPKLTYLNLGGNGISDAGLESLVASKSLTTLEIHGTKVTEAGAYKLHAALPNCRIEWGDGKVIEPKPAPKLPAGDSPPAKDAFPGTLVFYDMFDNPKVSTLFQGMKEGKRHTIENGTYIVEMPEAKAGQGTGNYFGQTGT